MADMLVKLFNLESTTSLEEKLLKEGIRIKRCLSPDRTLVMEFAKTLGDMNWYNEVNAAFSNNPVTCYIATLNKKIIGFAAFEATAKNFFGPMGVKEEYRNKGIGKVLLLKALHSMEEMGYAYAIIGWPDKKTIPFYQKCVNGVMIDEESSGVYKRMVEIDE